jgi:hypothetical protein
MPVLAESELDKLATQVVDQYLAGSARLDEAAAKQAADSGLNPDQIERLTQSANTQTFLRLMDQRKQAAATDLMHEFEPIDARQVIKIVIDKAGIHVEQPGAGDECKCNDKDDELPDEMSQMRSPMGAAGETEVKAASLADDVEAPLTPREQEKLKSRMRKLGSVMQDEILQAGYTFEEKFEALVDGFRRHPEKYAAFEKDARVEHGDLAGLGLINVLRSRLRMPTLVEKVGFEKNADFHVSDETPEMAQFEGLLDIVSQVEKLAQGVNKIAEQCAR